MLPVILFYVFSALTIACSLAVITAKDPVKAVLFLILTFFNAAGLFILLKAEFIAMLLVIVYVGAVAILFLFVVMMLNINMTKMKDHMLDYAPLGLLVAFVMFIELFFVIEASQYTMKERSNILISSNEVTSTIAENVEVVTNTEVIGRVLYTEYALLFQLSGLILLVAMIGAITLAHRRREGVKKQKIADQVARDRRKTVKVIKVETGKGV